jgi:integrase
LVSGKKDRKRIKWVESFKSGKKWFLKLAKQHGEKEGTKKNYAMALERFTEYMKMNPDEIITAYTEALDQNVRKAVEEWNDNLDLFVPWAIKRYGLSRSRARDHFAGIKSFFDNNVAIKLTAKTPEAYSKQRLPVTIEDIREKILPHADMQETFIISFLKDSGVSQAEALRLNVGDIEDLGNGFGYMRVHRKKEGVDYETFIGPNAMKAMRQYLEYRKREGEIITDESPLFTKKNKLGERMARNLISWQLTKLGKKAGVNLSTHRLRKCFETFLAIGKVHPIILKYWMGHKIGRDIEGRYIIPPKEEQIKLYMEAYKHIDLESEKVSEEERRIQATFDNLRLTGFSEEDIERYRAQRGKTWRTAKELITVVRQRVRRPKPADNMNNADCPDGKNCPTFKEINESELLVHLQDGWKITHNLQNGKVIVSK